MSDPDTDTLHVKIFKCVMKHNPKLLACDLEAAAEASQALGDMLGCLMAFVLVIDPHNYAERLRTLMTQINERAYKTACKSANPHGNDNHGTLQ